ncbi:MAG: hypothetical protein KAT49_02605 [Methanomicrobia archaeon]|nr:hypothetical protein [Methanomicrobia archaeon]
MLEVINVILEYRRRYLYIGILNYFGDSLSDLFREEHKKLHELLDKTHKNLDEMSGEIPEELELELRKKVEEFHKKMNEIEEVISEPKKFYVLGEEEVNKKLECFFSEMKKLIEKIETRHP